MIRIPVTSSAISSIGWEADTETLEVCFPSGACWQYASVGHSTYDSLMAAESIGAYFITNIRSNFVGHRVHDPNCQTNSDCWCHRQRKDVTEEKNRAAKVEEVESKSVKASKARPAKRRQAV